MKRGESNGETCHERCQEYCGSGTSKRNEQIENCAFVRGPYDEGVRIILQVKESIRPEVGNRIRFTFREQEMIGIIYKLLANSAIVVIDWNASNTCMKDICESRTVVNFKDIVEFLPLEEE